MASCSVAGKVICKEGEPPVTIREFGNGGKIAKFSVLDSQYFYVKEGDDRKGQFYNVEVTGKIVDIVADRLKRGDRIKVDGQLVLRDYNERTYCDIKNGDVTFMEDREMTTSSAF